MKKIAFLAWALLAGTILSCDSGAPLAPPPPTADGRLEVFVEWGQTGVSDRRLEIVELGLTQMTDANGNAAFVVRPGKYTLRAYVNHGGPSMPQDIAVTIRPRETTRVEVADCLPCVSPG